MQEFALNLLISNVIKGYILFLSRSVLSQSVPKVFVLSLLETEKILGQLKTGRLRPIKFLTAMPGQD